MSGADRLRQALRRLRGPKRETYDPGTTEWAESIETRMQVVERQLKILNGSLLVAVLADIALRLLKP